MASDEEKKLVEQTPEKEPAGQEQESGSSLISKVGKIFLIIVALVLQGWLAYTVVGKNYKSIYKMVNGSAKNDPGVFYEIKDIVVNPADTKGERYLLVSLGIELNEKQDLDIMKKHNPIIRDRIISTLAQESMNDLSSIQGRHKLKVDLLNTINDIVKKKMVRNLFFTEYVMQ
jgi:flagellar basal body-associated protein FliL